MSTSSDKSNLSRPLSLGLSVVLGALPIALYALGSGETGKRSLLFEAMFWSVLSLLFLGARRYSTSVAVFAAVRWLVESWATFARQYRTAFFGVLCLCALAATLFELLVGIKVTHLFSSAA